MSSAGRAASSSGCVGRPRERETGLIGHAESIQRSLPTGGSAMETAEHREPYESRGSRTDLGAPGGESPPGDSTIAPSSARRARIKGRRLSDGLSHLRTAGGGVMRPSFHTPRTVLTWATLDEWLDCARKIERRRASTLRNRQAELHVRALPVRVVYQCSSRVTLA